MKTIIIVVALLFASCSSPVTRPEPTTQSKTALVDSSRAQAKKSSGMGSELVLGSLATLIILYVILGPKN
jgi:hypothetical protein